MAAGRLQVLISVDDRRKAPTGEIEEAKIGSVVLVDRYPNLGWFQYTQVFVLDAFQVSEKIVKVSSWPDRTSR